MAESLDHPFRAEYSKSNRASCRMCKTQISQGTLRLAAMVQSPVHDGKIPHWYHYTCFFKKQRPKSAGDVAHLDSLRWEDQKKIKDSIESAGSLPDAGGKKGKKRPSSSPEMKNFLVEYAKSNRSTCRGCEQKINKEELRISKKDFESEQGRRYGGLDQWHHLECFVKLRESLEFWGSGADLPGAKSLEADDLKKLKQSLPKIEGKTDVKPEKRPKTEDDDKGIDSVLQKQNKLIFKYRDYLKNLKKPELVELLEDNGQSVPVGVDSILDHLSDCMAFGSLEPCTDCGGQFRYVSGIGYKCTGDATEFARCQKTTLEPKRSPFVVPAPLKESDSFLAKYKYVPQKRVIKVSVPSTSASTSSNGVDKPKTLIQRPGYPFSGLEIAIVGKTEIPKKDLKENIEKLGGKVVSKVNEGVALVISNAKTVKKISGEIKKAKEHDVYVVSEDFVEKVGDQDVFKFAETEKISDWGSLPTVAKERQKSAAERSNKSKSQFTKSVPGGKMKVQLKDGLSVDPDSDLVDVAHVYKQGKDVYTAVLGLTDIQLKKNSFYRLQLLESDSQTRGFHRYWVFRSWGRIGTTIGGHKTEECDNKDHALRTFRSVYEEKTGNRWEDRHNFVKVPHLMYPIDVDYQADQPEKVNYDNLTVKSKLPTEVQDLMKLIFDITSMKSVMQEFELDLEKMPLGKLSRKQIQQAYSVLTRLDDLVKRGGSDIDFLDACNRFYTLVPHDFGIDDPPIIRTEDEIKKKIEMLDSLMEIECAYNLMTSCDSKEGSDVHPLDAQYSKLNTDIEVLDRTSEEFTILEKYVKNTHAATHRMYDLEIVQVFKVRRHHEEKRFKPFKKLHNRKLLWHGSRLTNFAGILSQGLRIAPPEAPATGYMFGKGIYFADMVSKSANYCCTSKQQPGGLLLLCDVALGNMYERESADYIEKLPSGKHSCKGLGMTEPDPKDKTVLPDGVEVPHGVGKQAHGKRTALLYNEYIVYDVAQVNIKYLLHLNFNYKY